MARVRPGGRGTLLCPASARGGDDQVEPPEDHRPGDRLALPQRAQEGAEGLAVLAWLPRLVARVPAPVYAKLLVAFLAIVALLITVGAVGLQMLSDVNRRAEDLVRLQRKIAAYRQLQHDTTAQLYSVASALLVPTGVALEATLRQLNQFGYDLDRLQFVARDEAELFGRVRD